MKTGDARVGYVWTDPSVWPIPGICFTLEMRRALKILSVNIVNKFQSSGVGSREIGSNFTSFAFAIVWWWLGVSFGRVRQVCNLRWADQVPSLFEISIFSWGRPRFQLMQIRTNEKNIQKIARNLPRKSTSTAPLVFIFCQLTEDVFSLVWQSYSAIGYQQVGNFQDFVSILCAQFYMLFLITMKKLQNIAKIWTSRYPMAL